MYNCWISIQSFKLNYLVLSRLHGPHDGPISALVADRVQQISTIPHKRNNCLYLNTHTYLPMFTSRILLASPIHRKSIISSVSGRF